MNSYTSGLIFGLTLSELKRVHHYVALSLSSYCNFLVNYDKLRISMPKLMKAWLMIGTVKG